MKTRGVAAAALAAAALALAPAAAAAAPGSLDPSFNGSGLVTLGAGSQLLGVAVQPNGEIVVAGQSGGSVLAQRYTTGGALDAQYLGAAGAARAVAIQPDGKIVIAGTSGGAMFVQRLTSGLTPDSSFGSGGRTTAFGGQSGVANAVAVGPGGVIAAAGTVGTDNTSFAVASFNSAGAPVFGEALQPQGLPYAVAQGIAVQPNGAIVIAGRDQGSPNFPFFNGLLVRLNANGSYDGSFNGSGIVSYHYPNGGYTSLNAVALQNNGEIVAAGVDVGGPNAIVVRVGAGGAFDQSFGSGGVAALPSGQNVNDNPGAPIGAYGVGIAGGGRIIGAGPFENTGTATDAAVWAFGAGGAPETAFGSGGVVRAPTNGYEACALAIAPDGSLVSAGDTVTTEPDMSPCAINGAAGGFIARYIGYGPPPAPVSTSAPTVTTGSAGAINEVSAEVSGQVNPGGLATSYHFDYGTSGKYGSSTPAGTLSAGGSAVGVSAQLTGLAPGTTYHYRLAASNAAGSADGTDRTFTTSTGPPSAVSGRASSITEVSARITGTLGSGGLQTAYHFDWGRTTKYGSSTKRATLVASGPAGAVSAGLVRLRPGTTYHYRLVASNADGTRYGADRKFTTLPRLAVALMGVPQSAKIATVEMQGIGLSLHCNQPCAISGSLTIPATTARPLKLGTRQLTIGSGTASRKRAGTSHLRLRLTSKYKGAIALLTRLAVTLQIRIAPVGGGHIVVVKRTITLTS